MRKFYLMGSVFFFLLGLLDIYLGMYGFAVGQFIFAGLHYMIYKRRTKTKEL